jgi:hypothetical protein
LIRLSNYSRVDVVLITRVVVIVVVSFVSVVAFVIIGSFFIKINSVTRVRVTMMIIRDKIIKINIFFRFDKHL